MKISFLTIGAVFLLQHAAAQNNPIFFGGAGDGYNRARYEQLNADSSIVHGGAGDGYSRNVYLPAVLSHASGGRGDGHSSYGYAQAITRITTGGSGDGYGSFSNGLPAVDRIFYGGIADGMATAATGAPGVDKLFFGGNTDGWASGASAPSSADRIFFGGPGDGWASDYIPLGPLPLNLLSFAGKEQGAANLLYWRTTAEVHTDGFVLERSATTRDFAVIGTVEAQGESKTEHDYSFTDAQPLTGSNFYRLKMIDVDGKFTYSNIVLLQRIGANAVLKVYPNPSASMLNIELSGVDNEVQLSVEVYDAAARLVTQAALGQGNGLLRLDVSGLAAGAYTIRAKDRDHIYIVRFVKTNP